MKNNELGLWLQIGALHDDQDYDDLVAITQCMRGTKRLGFKWDLILGDNRKAELVDARRICCSHLYKKGWAMTKIAAQLGYTNHTSVLYHKNRAVELYEYDREFRFRYDQFMNA